MKILIIISTISLIACTDIATQLKPKETLETIETTDSLSSEGSENSVSYSSTDSITKPITDHTDTRILSSSSTDAHASSFSENISSQIKPFYPTYVTGTSYNGGDIVTVGETLYQCRTGVTVPWCSSEAYRPGGIYSNSAWDIIDVESIESDSNKYHTNSSSSTETSFSSSDNISFSSSATDNSYSSALYSSGNALWKPWTKRKSNRSVIGYYASWQWYDRSKKAAPEHIDFSKWTRVNFAFFHPSADGKLHITDDWADPQVLFGPTNWNPSTDATPICISFMRIHATNGNEVCGHYAKEKGLIELAHKAGTEVYPSIGGWTLSDYFPAIAASPKTRAKFASESVQLLRHYNFDGIDIDWEYPGYTDHKGTAQDKVNFITLLQEIKDSIDAYGKSLNPARTFGLTAALPCGDAIIDNGINVPALTSILTEFNLMTYDFHGAFNSKVDHNSPLYNNGIHNDQPRFNVQGCVDNYLERGASAERLNIGAGFYGRSFAGATDLGQPHTGNDLAHWPEDEGMPMYYAIVNKINAGLLTRKWDALSKVPYAVFDNGGVVSYEDKESITFKSDFIRNKELGGIIVWEMSGDIMDNNTTPLLNILTRLQQD